MGELHWQEGRESKVNAEEWKLKIESASKEAGTYRPFFDIVINQLSEIMAIRDSAKKQFNASGGNPVVAYTNKGGHTNLRKNPALVVINECNQQALAYWRDLGLTPSGFKKLDGVSVKVEKDSFAELLADIGI